MLFPGGVLVQAFGLSGLVVSVEEDSFPDWALYLDERWRDQTIDWTHCFVEWPDFGVPADEPGAFSAFEEAWRRAKSGQVVDIACDGGTGRTGTALACLALLAGIPRIEVVPWVRANYHPWAVEVPEQEEMIDRFDSWRERRIPKESGIKG